MTTQTYIDAVETFMQTVKEANHYAASNIARGNFRMAAYFYITDRARLEANTVEALTKSLEGRLTESESRMKYWGSYLLIEKDKAEELAMERVQSVLDYDPNAPKQQQSGVAADLGLYDAKQVSQAQSKGELLGQVLGDVLDKNQIAHLIAGTVKAAEGEVEAIKAAINASYVEYVKAVREAALGQLAPLHVEYPAGLARMFFEGAYDSLLGTPVMDEDGSITLLTASDSAMGGFPSLIQNRVRNLEKARTPATRTAITTEILLLKEAAKFAESEALRMEHVLQNGGAEAEDVPDNKVAYDIGDENGVLHKDETGMDVTEHGSGNGVSTSR